MLTSTDDYCWLSDSHVLCCGSKLARVTGFLLFIIIIIIIMPEYD